MCEHKRAGCGIDVGRGGWRLPDDNKVAIVTKELQENPSALSCHSSIHDTACRGVGFVSVHTATKCAVRKHTSAASPQLCQ